MLGENEPDLMCKLATGMCLDVDELLGMLLRIGNGGAP